MVDVETQDEEVGPQSVDNSHATVSDTARLAPNTVVIPPVDPQIAVIHKKLSHRVPQTVDTVTVDTVHTVGLQGEECCASASSPVLHLPLPLTLAG